MTRPPSSMRKVSASLAWRDQVEITTPCGATPLGAAPSSAARKAPASCRSAATGVTPSGPQRRRASP